MAVVTISIEPDELAGLKAVAELDEVANGRRPEVAEAAGALMHAALAAKLDELGLAWAPSPDAVRRRAAQAAKPPSRLMAVLHHDRIRRYAGAALATAVLVVLWGGYVQGWAWTGFRANNQLWDWLQLLLLPIVVGTIPLWIRHAGDITPAKRMTHLAVIAALAGFTVLAYLIPWHWTGFPGKTLWDWFGLLLLPAALAIAPELSAAIRSLRPYHRVIIAVLALGWVATIVGGYALNWAWTGYEGNTLWDWLELLLLPLVVPIVLVPLTLRWVAGQRAESAPGLVSRASS
jgi:hypothetical protein